MPTILRNWLRAEHGASAISLLATVAALVIGAVIAVGALKQSGTATQAGQAAAATAQAQDQQAQQLLETGQTAMATYASSSSSGYAGVTPSALAQIEPTLITASATQAFLSAASGTATSYTMSATDPLTGDTFTLSNNSGASTRTCTPVGRGGCSASGTF